jgi:hypothetical protein
LLQRCFTPSCDTFKQGVSVNIFIFYFLSIISQNKPQ